MKPKSHPTVVVRLKREWIQSNNLNTHPCVRCAASKLERCKQLLASPDLNIDVDVEKSDGSTPMILAATMGHAEVVDFLIEASLSTAFTCVSLFVVRLQLSPGQGIS